MPITFAPVRHPLAVRRLTVVDVESLSPSMIRVRLGGVDLADLVTVGPTDHIKLLVPGAGEGDLELPVVEDGRIRFPEGKRPNLRDYTIRRHEDSSNEILVDIAFHDGGHVSEWARRTRLGAVVGTGGPRGSHPMPQADSYTLIGDPTSLPAIGRWVEEIPAGTSVDVLIAVAGSDHEVELQARAAITAVWVHGEPGRPDADALASALDRIDLAGDDRYVWAAGEVLAMRDVRDRLLEEFGLASDHVSVEGYWRRGEVDYDHHRTLDDD